MMRQIRADCSPHPSRVTSRLVCYQPPPPPPPPPPPEPPPPPPEKPEPEEDEGWAAIMAALMPVAIEETVLEKPEDELDQSVPVYQIGE